MFANKQSYPLCNKLITQCVDKLPQFYHTAAMKTCFFITTLFSLSLFSKYSFAGSDALEISALKKKLHATGILIDRYDQLRKSAKTSEERQTYNTKYVEQSLDYNDILSQLEEFGVTEDEEVAPEKPSPKTSSAPRPTLPAPANTAPAHRSTSLPTTKFKLNGMRDGYAGADVVQTVGVNMKNRSIMVKQVVTDHQYGVSTFLSIVPFDDIGKMFSSQDFKVSPKYSQADPNAFAIRIRPKPGHQLTTELNEKSTVVPFVDIYCESQEERDLIYRNIFGLLNNQ